MAAAKTAVGSGGTALDVVEATGAQPVRTPIIKGTANPNSVGRIFSSIAIVIVSSRIASDRRPAVHATTSERASHPPKRIDCRHPIARVAPSLAPNGLMSSAAPGVFAVIGHLATTTFGWTALGFRSSAAYPEWHVRVECGPNPADDGENES